ncbi:MAG TPA: aminoglycoside 6'-N-acetyltransferase [Vicinamibacteria bacterium]|nr:aminoglycoside 6'-N-acetyltransferase [Vicinamibacteria bacterium]
MTETVVRAVEKRDKAAWIRMRTALWPGAEEEHTREIESYFAGSAFQMNAVLVAEANHRLLGFIELAIRPSAEGSRSERVGYIEGWFVVPEARRRGVGRALVEAAEDWARSRGLIEMASDTELDNETSARTHEALGYEETARIRCFLKRL